MSDYPNHDRMRENSEQLNAVFNFIEYISPQLSFKFEDHLQKLAYKMFWIDPEEEERERASMGREYYRMWGKDDE